MFEWTLNALDWLFVIAIILGANKFLWWAVGTRFRIERKKVEICPKCQNKKEIEEPKKR